MSKRSKLSSCRVNDRLKPHIRAITDMVVAMGGVVDVVLLTKHYHVHFTLDCRPGRLVVAGTPRCADEQLNYARQQLQRHRRAVV